MKFGELIGVTIEEKSLTFIVKKVISEHREFGGFIETTIGTSNYYFQNASDELLNSDVRSIHLYSKNEMEVYVK
nr:MAG TPA: hypothetical protein [Caudoviricetes sp.]